jgi:phosphatidate phosphatase LPIN
MLILNSIRNTPTDNEMEKLHLKDARNSIILKVGNHFLEAEIILWEHTDKIEISDIDGTITKSEIIGQIANLLNMDWLHEGVFKLLSKGTKEYTRQFIWIIRHFRWVR